MSVWLGKKIELKKCTKKKERRGAGARTGKGEDNGRLNCKRILSLFECTLLVVQREKYLFRGGREIQNEPNSAIPPIHQPTLPRQHRNRRNKKQPAQFYFRPGYEPENM